MTITQQVLLSVFALAFVLGAVANKTNFCTMGAVSDWVNMGDRGRLAAWVFAMAVAVAGVLALEAAGVVDTGDSRVPYRGTLFMWPRYILGGLLFGVGMTLASGCGNKCLVRIGGGNLKSILVLAIAAFFAYLMTRTDFYGVVFHSWMNPISLDLAAHGMRGQDLGGLLAGLFGAESLSALRIGAALLVTAALLVFALRVREFRSSLDNWIGGVAVGAIIVAGWWISGGPWGAAWQEAADFMDVPPEGVGVQSYTFIAPMADSLAYVLGGAKPNLLTFGVVTLVGVILGSLVASLVLRSFRFEWFASWGDFARHAVGAVLMGVGGVLALGCTIGQGVTGVSTLALGSFISLACIVLGAALTMKLQYYRMLYEEASVADALITGLVDLRLLPERLRRLEAL